MKMITFLKNCPQHTTSPLHIATKIKTRLLKPYLILPMGDYFVSKKHLEQLIEEIPKDQHLLTLFDLEGKWILQRSENHLG